MISRVKALVPEAVWNSMVRLRFRQLAANAHYRAAFAGKVGLEIGGPSPFFRAKLPVYEWASRIDGVNFATETVWEGNIGARQSYLPIPGKPGQQFIAEASDLSEIADASYDFLVSCNNLEHVANALKAVGEWHRVVRPGGYLLMILPRKESNFDHRRPVTKFEHLVDDLERGVGEDDQTHLDEILELHDLSRDPMSGGFEPFKARAIQNIDNRCLHHHIFDLDVTRKMFEFYGMEVVTSNVIPQDIVMLGRKPATS